MAMWLDKEWKHFYDTGGARRSNASFQRRDTINTMECLDDNTIRVEGSQSSQWMCPICDFPCTIVSFTHWILMRVQRALHCCAFKKKHWKNGVFQQFDTIFVIFWTSWLTARLPSNECVCVGVLACSLPRSSVELVRHPWQAWWTSLCLGRALKLHRPHVASTSFLLTYTQHQKRDVHKILNETILQRFPCVIRCLE